MVPFVLFTEGDRFAAYHHRRYVGLVSNRNIGRAALHGQGLAHGATGSLWKYNHHAGVGFGANKQIVAAVIGDIASKSDKAAHSRILE